MTPVRGVHRWDRLTGVHPTLAAAVRRIVGALLDEGYVAVITQGVRTAGQQAALYAIGRTRPGKIVTNCDGARRKSAHQVKPDGFGHAVDLAWHNGRTITWDGPWDRLGALARAEGLVWGGDWVTFPDRLHVELR